MSNKFQKGDEVICTRLVESATEMRKIGVCGTVVSVFQSLPRPSKIYVQTKSNRTTAFREEELELLAEHNKRLAQPETSYTIGYGNNI